MLWDVFEDLILGAIILTILCGLGAFIYVFALAVVGNWSIGAYIFGFLFVGFCIARGIRWYTEPRNPTYRWD